MTTAQRVIKYLALAFAFFLIFNILSGIIFGLSMTANLLGLKDSENTDSSSKKVVSEIFENSPENLEINLESAELIIKQGDSFKAETNSEYVTFTEEDGTLKIKEKTKNLINSHVDNYVKLFLPKDTTFNTVNLESGASRIQIDFLETDTLSFEIGAGKTALNGLTVHNSAYIEGGAGEVCISGDTINNLDLSVGVGKFTLDSKLTGENKIEAGIGDLSLKLHGEKENYKLKVSTGVGSIVVFGMNVKNGTYGNGDTCVQLDGGIGKLEVSEIK